MAAFLASQMAVVPVARAAVSAKAQAAPVAPRAVKVVSFLAHIIARRPPRLSRHRRCRGRGARRITPRT
jgi:hypothetical protein